MTNVLLVGLALALTLGLTACDSSGSNSEEETSDDEPDIAKTFTVTVEPVDDSYPYREQNGIGVAYAIDGEIGKEITLERGKTYEFLLDPSVANGPNGSSHPFYIGETARGAGGDEFRDDPAKKTEGSVLFSPPSGASDSLYYQCSLHVYMGGKMEITGSTSSNDDGSGGDDGDGGGDY